MFASLLTNKWTLSIAAFVLVVGIGYGYFKYNEIQYEQMINQLESQKNELVHNEQILKENQKTLETDLKKLAGHIDSQKMIIMKMERELKQVKNAHSRVTELEREFNSRISTLDKKFSKETKSGKKRDFGKITLVKPGLVENIINKASANKLRCFEIATGAEFTIDEMNDGYVNRECPQYFKGE